MMSVCTIGKVFNMRQFSYMRLFGKRIREVLTSHAHVPNSSLQRGISIIQYSWPTIGVRSLCQQENKILILGFLYIAVSKVGAIC
jgi:hypothetical protein